MVSETREPGSCCTALIVGPKGLGRPCPRRTNAEIRLLDRLRHQPALPLLIRDPEPLDRLSDRPGLIGGFDEAQELPTL
jgi:hypothetical protein